MRKRKLKSRQRVALLVPAALLLLFGVFVV
jgi:hypothetical protein